MEKIKNKINEFRKYEIFEDEIVYAIYRCELINYEFDDPNFLEQKIEKIGVLVGLLKDFNGFFIYPALFYDKKRSAVVFYVAINTKVKNIYEFERLISKNFYNKNDITFELDAVLDYLDFVRYINEKLNYKISKYEVINPDKFARYIDGNEESMPENF